MLHAASSLESRIIEALLEKGLLYPFALEEHYKAPTSEQAPRCLLEALVDRGILEATDISTVTQELYRFPWVNLSDLTNAPLKTIPYADALKHKLFPLYETADALALAVAEPSKLALMEGYPGLEGKQILPHLASETALNEAIERYYTPVPTAAITFTTKTVSFEDALPTDVVHLADNLINIAYHARASDIHLEPLVNRLRIRLRIDGHLQEHPCNIPKEAWAALLTRIKLMARLDIAQKRLPQDGRIPFSITNNSKEISLDLRVATLPSLHGESVVIRLLDRETLNKPISSLGLSVDDQKAFEKVLAQPDGMCLATGPTGSGKTTTLYSILNYLNNPERKIITIEDPVEYQILGINQVPVRPKVGMTFATALRSILRQSPDIIMIGEIRDVETAKIAIHAALTGHKVFATLHTQSALGAVTRLLDMGIPSFLVAAAVRACLSQRLVRRLCLNCQGSQCDQCSHTGYRGRLGLFELLVIDEQLQTHIHNQATPTQLRTIVQQQGFKTLKEDGLAKVQEGLTSKAEIFSCC